MTDIVTRRVAQLLGERWRQPVVVENHGGAGITVGTALVARSSPDGYTLLMADRTAIAVAPNLYRNLSYDPLRDLAPVALVAAAPQLFMTHPSVPAASLREFLDYARQRPGALDYASAGPGTAIHITGEMLKQVGGIDMTAVQYKGGGAAMLAIVSGEVKVGFGLLPVALPQVKGGKVKALAITGNRRFSGAPDVPTMAEAGLPSFGSDYYWMGLLAPARTPAGIVERVNRDTVELLRDPALQAALFAQGAEPMPGSPGEFTSFIAAETAKLHKIVEIAGLRTD
jgi:tripartite-type tricarboxylate transporter receptor subunit TctC